jgi:AraC family transcriptional regulator of arabinose operon
MDNSDLLRSNLTTPGQLSPQLWAGSGTARNPGVSPVYITRYSGPRGLAELSSHDFWELTYSFSGQGVIELTDHQLALTAESAVLLPPGTLHREQTSHSKWDTLWLAFEGSLPGVLGVTVPLLLADAHALGPWGQAIWRWAQHEKGGIGPELDAACEFFVRALVRLAATGNSHERRDWLHAVFDYIDHHLDCGICVEDLAAVAGLSVGHFHRLFRQATCETPVQYLTRRRLETALLYLQQSGLSVKAVAEAVGFNDPLYFSRVFRKRFGMPPSDVC